MISHQQMKILAFPYTGYDALICDGAIRSGKTSLMFVAFVDWAMASYAGQRFVILGKTVGSVLRNVVEPYMTRRGYHCDMGYAVKAKNGGSRLVVRKGSRENTFDIFGAKDDSSYMLIQGFTAAGVFVDEVALCNEKAFNQALARCSVDGSKLWFNCNPDGPSHWFKVDWIDRAAERNALYLHFGLDDNPALSEAIKARYRAMYTGVFADRYIKGLWTRAEGLIYPEHQAAIEPTYQGGAKRWAVSCDYGTQNAFAALKWCLGTDGIWHCVDEYYHSGRDTGHQKTDADYVSDMLAFCEGMPDGVTFVVDPSAASFIAALRRARRFHVRKARNDVVDGIRQTSVAMQSGAVRIGEGCKSLVGELAGYVWDDKHGGDVPLKVADHACDALRYHVATHGIAWKDTRPYVSPITGGTY